MKNVKSIIALGSAVAVLAGVLTAVLIINGNDGNEELPTEAEAVTVVSLCENTHTENDVKRITLENTLTADSGKLTVVPSEEADEKFTILGYDEFRLDHAMLDGMAKTILETELIPVTAQGEAEQYGFGAVPQYALFEFDDGEELKIFVGDQAPAIGQIYVQIDGGIYTAHTSKINAVLGGPGYYVSKVLIDVPEGENSGMQTMSIMRKDLDYAIVFEYDDERKSDDKYTGGTSAAHVLKEPFFAYLDVTRSVDYTHNLFGVTADSIFILNPDAEDLALAGFGAAEQSRTVPDVSVIMETQDGLCYRIELVKQQTGDMYFARVYEQTQVQTNENTENLSQDASREWKAHDLIYVMTEELFPWLNLQVKDVISPLIIGEYFYALKKADIKAEGEPDMVFNCTGTDKDDFFTSLNGSKEDCTDRFRAFYTFMLNIASEEVYMPDEETGEPAGEPAAEIKVENIKGRTTELKFYKDGASKLIIQVNGVTCFKCRESLLEVLKGNMQMFGDEQKTFTVTW
ncbi:MAG: DUF4340 domain-containing protein [Oscillospiraceae bacterium]|jgi:hypothetical protein|nr:DUF4340 domain-containing protein [Oscillospiraceae bacterium]